MKRALIAAIAATLLLGACGDDGDSGLGNGSGGGSGTADPEAVETIKASLMDDADGFGMEESDAECIAERMAGELGTDRVEEIDWEASTPAFTDDEVDVAIDSFDRCLDLGELFARTIDAPDVSEESLACVAEETDDDDVAALFRQTFREDGEVTEELLTPLDEVLKQCLTEEEYESIS